MGQYSIGADSEYSWPFVDEVKLIAGAICTENTLANRQSPPTVHVLSDGGLDKYAIHVEQKRPFGGNRRILTIAFPRSLKHFVLLHPVLGHELGHAIQGSQYEVTLERIIQTNLLQNSAKFRDSAATAAWLFSASAPADFQATLKISDATQLNFFAIKADWASWKEEIVCDLIGLVTFGPSFVAALCQLLYSLVPSGNGYSPYHPPVASRTNMMLSAMRILGFDQIAVADSKHIAATNDFWKSLEKYRKTDPWFDLFTNQELKATLDQLRIWLGAHPPSCYDSPEPVMFAKLLSQLANKNPPIGFELNVDGVPSCSNIDFRHILYAGWVASEGSLNTSFAQTNRLCEHAIMQQKAISLFTSKP